MRNDKGTAVDELVSQAAGPVFPVDFQRAAQGVDIDTFMLDAIRSVGADIDVAGSITDGYIERSIAEPSKIQVVVHDHTRALQQSDIWSYSVDVEVDGNWFRLIQTEKDGDDLTLTFEDRIVAWLRQHKKPLAISRNKVTRAQFIQQMIAEIHEDNKLGLDIHFQSPQLNKKQDIAKVKAVKHKARRSQKLPGLHKDIDINMKGHAATKQVKANLEAVLDVGIKRDAPEILLVAAVACVTQESSGLTTATNGTHVGMFQQDERTGTIWRQLGGATRDPTKDANAFFHQLEIAYKRATGVQTVAGLIEAVQGSGQGSLYTQWVAEAQATVREYNGGAGGKDVADTQSSTYERTYAQQYQFTRGQPGGPKHEDSWAAGQRLAEEVRWRLFIVGNTVYYYTDNDLLKAKPIMVIDEDSPGIDTIDYDVDDNKESNEATITCRAERWLAHPGEVVTLKKTMGKAQGRWLVETIHRPLFSEDTTITLYRPVDPLKEPAPDLNTVSKERKSAQNKGDGAVHIAPGANKAGQPVQAHVIDFLKLVAGETSEEILIICGTNHNYLTTSGNVSDHASGQAADIGVGGDARSSKDARSKGTNIAAAALVILGVDRETARKWASTDNLLNFSSPASVHLYRGYRVQIGWLTLVGGNHYNHVHIGLKG